MGNVRHIQYTGILVYRVYPWYRDFFWLRFTEGGDPLLKGAPFAGRPRFGVEII